MEKFNYCSSATGWKHYVINELIKKKQNSRQRQDKRAIKEDKFLQEVGKTINKSGVTMQKRQCFQCIFERKREKKLE